MPRLTVKTVKSQIAQSGYSLEIRPGKGYTVVKGNSRVFVKDLEAVLAQVGIVTAKAKVTKMLGSKDFQEKAKYGHELTKMDSNTTRNGILAIKGWYEDCCEFEVTMWRNAVTKWMRQYEQREINKEDMISIVKQHIAKKTEQAKAIMLFDNLRDNFKTEIAGAFYLSQVK